MWQCKKQHALEWHTNNFRIPVCDFTLRSPKSRFPYHSRLINCSRYKYYIIEITFISDIKCSLKQKVLDIIYHAYISLRGAIYTEAGTNYTFIEIPHTIIELHYLKFFRHNLTFSTSHHVDIFERKRKVSYKTCWYVCGLSPYQI